MKPKGRNQLNQWLFLFLSFFFPLLLQCAILLYDKLHRNFVFNLSPRIQHDVICHLLFFFPSFIVYPSCLSFYPLFSSVLFFLITNFFNIQAVWTLLGSIALLFTFTFFYGRSANRRWTFVRFCRFSLRLYLYLRLYPCTSHLAPDFIFTPPTRFVLG